MHFNEAMHYCQICSKQLEQIDEHSFICQTCDRVWYINPIPSNAAIIVRDGKILLVRRAADPKKGYWDLPGGFIQAGEQYTDSLLREIKEEIGCNAEIKEIIGVYADTYEYQRITFPTLCIVARVEIPYSSEITVADDVDGYQFFTPDSLPEDRIAFPSLQKALRDFQQLNDIRIE